MESTNTCWDNDDDFQRPMKMRRLNQDADATFSEVTS